MEEYDYAKLKSCGKDVRISKNVVIKYPELVSIGNHVAIDDFFYVTTTLEIGDYVHIGPFCSIIGGKSAICTFKDFSGLAAGCRIICGSDDYLGSGLTNPTVPKEYHAKLHIEFVTLEKHVVLGTNCVVHPGVVIGEGGAVGSCSLVTKNLDPWQIYIGIPAKVVKSRDKDHMLNFEKQLRDAGL